MEGQFRHAVFIFQAFSANSASNSANSASIVLTDSANSAPIVRTNSASSANSACLAEAKTQQGGRVLWVG